MKAKEYNNQETYCSQQNNNTNRIWDWQDGVTFNAMSRLMCGIILFLHIFPIFMEILCGNGNVFSLC